MSQSSSTSRLHHREDQLQQHHHHYSSFDNLEEEQDSANLYTHYQVQELSSSRRKRKIIVSISVCSCLCITGLLFFGALFVVGWFCLGNYLFEVAFGISSGNCDQFRENSSQNFTLLYDCPPLTEPESQWYEKLAPFYVNSENTEIVNFKSRPIDWIQGLGSANIVGTLYKQEIINSTSKFAIIVHGYRVCRLKYDSLLPSGILYHAGYNILSIDLRNHGDSSLFEQIKFVSFGNFEHLDVLGAFDYLLERFPFLSETNNVGLFGSSMGAATSAIAFAREDRIKIAFLDSPPCNVYQTLLFGAKAMVSSDPIATVGLETIKSVSPLKVSHFGFPPFHNDPIQLLRNVNLSNNRKIFFLQTVGDLIVPSFNQEDCLKATMESVSKNGYNPESVQSYMGTIVYPENFQESKRTRNFCNNHIAFQFNNLNKFKELLMDFYLKNL